MIHGSRFAAHQRVATVAKHAGRFKCLDAAG
jgi:hypothetical protein